MCQSDSFKLWKMICSNRLLQSVNLVLFLNKMDILDANLKSGIRFSRYVPNYKDAPNTAEQVSKCEYLVVSLCDVCVVLTRC